MRLSSTMRKVLFLNLALLLLSTTASAQRTRTWQQSRFDDFQKGTAQGVAIRSTGTLELAPAFKPLATTPSTYLWDIASDARGNVYAAAGAPARVYRVTADGKVTSVFEPKELQVQAMAVDRDGTLYAATSPDGQVYRITHSGQPAAKPATASAAAEPNSIPTDPAYKSEAFFDPKTKYIWALALDKEGRLYVATGDRGEVFRVNKNGDSALFFKTDEAHIRSLAFDAQGNLIAGSDGSGLVYRISPAGEGFILYSAPKKEITALAIDANGNIFAAGIGEKRSTTPTSTFTPPSTVPLQTPGGQPVQLQTPGGPQTQSPPTPTLTLPSFSSTGGSEIYQLAPNGSPRRIWSSREDIVYALSFDQRGRLLAGTGNKGRIYAIDSRGDYTDLVKASATQVTGFATGAGGVLYVSTSNLGKVFSLAGAPEAQGTFDSDVFDARIFSRWGRAEVRGAGAYELHARSGNVDNPDRNWSPWKRVELEREGVVDIPAARFVQWRAVLKAGEPAARIDSVLLHYRANNVAPALDDVTVQVGMRFQSLPRPSGGPSSSSSDSGPSTGAGGPSAQQSRFEPLAPSVRDRNSIGARWTVRDENDDEMVYSVYYRGDGERRWKLLKADVTDRFYSFDAGLLPDGGYVIKVIASDAPAQTPGEALTDERESARFEVDNTPPQVEDLNSALEGDQLRITFRAADAFSPVKRAEYSVDAGEWQLVEPIGLLSDSRVEHYDATIPVPRNQPSPANTAAGPEEHVVVVRVYDRFDNMGTGRAVVREGKK